MLFHKIIFSRKKLVKLGREKMADIYLKMLLKLLLRKEVLEAIKNAVIKWARGQASNTQSPIDDQFVVVLEKLAEQAIAFVLANGLPSKA